MKDKTIRKPTGKNIEQEINAKFQKIIDDEPKVERKEITQLEAKKNTENEK